MDMEFAENMYERLYKKANPNEIIVGWYVDIPRYSLVITRVSCCMLISILIFGIIKYLYYIIKHQILYEMV